MSPSTNFLIVLAYARATVINVATSSMFKVDSKYEDKGKRYKNQSIPHKIEPSRSTFNSFCSKIKTIRSHTVHQIKSIRSNSP